MSETQFPLLGSSPDDMEEIRQARKVEVALGYRIFAAQHWGDLGDGHISARDPERMDCFWLLRYGVSYHEARVSDLVLVDPDGQLVEGDGFINRAAYYIHHPILAARPDAASAVHVHTAWGTPFAAERRPVEPISQEACIFFEDHAIFDDEGAERAGGVIHCFTGDAPFAADCMARGFDISFSGILTFGNADELREVAKGLPLERLLIETDSPLLAPVPHRGRRNQPAWVGHVAECLAELHGRTPALIGEQTTVRACRAFGIEGLG